MYPEKHREVFKSSTQFFDDEAPGHYPFVLFRTSPKEENRDCAIVGYAINRNIDQVQHNIVSEPIRVIKV